MDRNNSNYLFKPPKIETVTEMNVIVINFDSEGVEIPDSYILYRETYVPTAPVSKARV